MSSLMAEQKSLSFLVSPHFSPILFYLTGWLAGWLADDDNDDDEWQQIPVCFFLFVFFCFFWFLRPL
jgi:hypothetical protein